MRLLAAAILTAIVLTAWFYPSEIRHYLVAEADTLPVNFAHADHRDENCIACHHNFADRTGDGLCLNCHERSASVGHLLEEHFHDLCRSCHVQRRADGLAHGPLRECQGCHVQTNSPFAFGGGL